MSSLVEDWVSKASARQRKGRAGRVRQVTPHTHTYTHTRPTHSRAEHRLDSDTDSDIGADYDPIVARTVARTVTRIVGRVLGLGRNRTGPALVSARPGTAWLRTLRVAWYSDSDFFGMLTRTLTRALTRTRAGQGICYHLVTSRRFSKFLDYQVGPARGVGGRGLRGQNGGRDEDSGRERGRDQGWGA